MENGHGGGSMSAGTPVAVGAPHSAEAVSRAVPQEVSEAASVTEAGGKTDVVAEGKAVSENIEAADKLIEIAKKDGVDAAFEELAADEKQEKGTTEPEKENKAENQDEKDKEKETSEKEKPENEKNNRAEDRDTMENKIADLSDKVDSLIEQKKQLEMRLLLSGNRMPEYNDPYYLIELLVKQLKEEAEANPKKKEGLIQLLLYILGEFIRGTFKEGATQAGKEASRAG